MESFSKNLYKYAILGFLFCIGILNDNKINKKNSYNSLVFVSGFVLTWAPAPIKMTQIETKRRIQELPSSSRYFHFNLQTSKRSSSSSSISDDAATGIESGGGIPMSISGVSVSNDGFWVMLTTASSVSSTNNNNENDNIILSAKVTNNKDDSLAATSPESLTIIQLISNVDMAGAVLPPEVLGNMLLSYCEENENEDDKKEEECSFVKEDVISSIRKGIVADKVRLQLCADNNDEDVENSSNYRWILDCSVPDVEGGTISFTPTWDILNNVLYRDEGNYNNYDYPSSLAFISIALALRYNSPIVLETSSNVSAGAAATTTTTMSLLPSSATSDDSIKVFRESNSEDNEQFKITFPKYASTTKLQSQSMRVEQKIEQSYKVHQLTNALRIATERNDIKACMKIQKQLDELDNFDDLPVLGEGFGKSNADNDNDGNENSNNNSNINTNDDNSFC